MLRVSRAFGSFAVTDLTAAREFYRVKLGLAVADTQPGGGGPLWLSSGDDSGGVLVYPKPDHRPADFTVLNLAVDDIEQAVDEIAASGIAMQRFAQYPQDARGILHGEGHSIAWFTDPAGNGLSVVQMHQGGA